MTLPRSLHRIDPVKVKALPSPHRISMVEAIAYTLLIGFVAALAEGWFDLMLPWSS